MSLSVLEINKYFENWRPPSYHAGLKLVFEGFRSDPTTIDLNGRVVAITPDGEAFKMATACLYGLESYPSGRSILDAANRAIERAEAELRALIDSDAREETLRETLRERYERYGNQPPEFQFGWRGFRNAGHANQAPLVQLAPPRKPSPLVEFPEARKIRLK